MGEEKKEGTEKVKRTWTFTFDPSKLIAVLLSLFRLKK